MMKIKLPKYYLIKFLLMKELFELLPQPVNSHHSLPKEEQFNLILAQLQERNIANHIFIKKYISKLRKKYHNREIPSEAHSLETCPEITQKKLESEENIAFLPSYQRFHTEETNTIHQLHDSIRESLLFHTNLSITEEKDDSVLKKIEWESESKTNQEIEEKTIRSATKQDQGFKNYLKKVFLKQVHEKKGSVPKAKRSLIRKSIEGLTLNRQTCLNIKSMIFGSQKLSDLQQENHSPGPLPPSTNTQISLIRYPSLQDQTEAKRLSNIFLPTILRQNGGRKDKIKVEKIMRAEVQTQQRSDSKCRALWLSQSMSRIGCSFRINTIQIKKHS